MKILTPCSTQYFTLLIYLITLLQACSTHQQNKNTYQDNYEHVKQHISKQVSKALRKHNIAAMQVLVLDDQEIIVNQAFGFADKENEIKATNDTAYRIGSISKMFTATAIMQLHEQGKLDIDKALSNYLPTFSIKSDYDTNDITLRKMLTHHSGLPSEFLKGINDTDRSNLLNELAQDYTSSAPDTVHSYSNLAYGLLGDVIEHISGLHYGDYMEQFLFKPSGMTQAIEGTDHPFMAKPYKEGDAIEYERIRDIAAGDLSMNATDLAQFVKKLLKNNTTGETAGLIQHPTLKEMWRTQNEDVILDNGFNMGLGWMLTKYEHTLYGLPHLAWHSGYINNFHSSLLIDTHNKLAVIVLSNSEEAGETVDTLSGELLLKSIESKTGYRHSPYQAKSQKAHNFTPEQLDNLPGEYLSPYIGAFSIKRKKERLLLSSDEINLSLIPMDDGSIGASYKLFGLFSIYDPSLKKIRAETIKYQNDDLLRIQNGPVIAYKITPSELPQQWTNHLGEYQEIIGHTQQKRPEWEIETVTLTNHKGYIEAQVSTKNSGNNDTHSELIYFKPINANRAVVVGYGRDTGNSVIIKQHQNGEHSIYFSGLRFKKIK